MDFTGEPGIFRGLKTLSIMPTFTCPAACKDCGTLSSPSERTQLSVDVILRTIAEAKELGFANVVFTGGEATLRWRELLECIAFADSLGFPTRVVTNAHWATSLERAEKLLGELIAARLSEINYSTGDEHVRFIPIERVIHATVAAVRRRFGLHIMVELRSERRVTRDTLLQALEAAGLTAEEREQVRIVESPWMPLNPSIQERYPEGVAVDRFNIGLHTGCDSVLQTYTLQSDGRIGCCCGLGLRTIQELNVATSETEGSLAAAIEEAENDFLKLWLHYKGPDKILAWAAEKDPGIRWEGMYGHHCQACQRVYKDPKVIAVIREHHQEILAEVLQGAWLEEKYIPEKVAGALSPA